MLGRIECAAAIETPVSANYVETKTMSDLPPQTQATSEQVIPAPDQRRMRRWASRVQRRRRRQQEIEELQHVGDEVVRFSLVLFSLLALSAAIGFAFSLWHLWHWLRTGHWLFTEG
jgi:hypothetical protein